MAADDLLSFPVVVGHGKRLFAAEGGQPRLTLGGGLSEDRVPAAQPTVICSQPEGTSCTRCS